MWPRHSSSSSSTTTTTGPHHQQVAIYFPWSRALAAASSSGLAELIRSHKEAAASSTRPCTYVKSPKTILKSSIVPNPRLVIQQVVCLLACIPTPQKPPTTTILQHQQATDYYPRSFAPTAVAGNLCRPSAIEATRQRFI